jgi:hypothetical protein
MKTLISFVLALFILSGVEGCSDSSVVPLTNHPYTYQDSIVQLVAPVNGSVYTAPDSVTVTRSWRKTVNAPQYHLQICSDSAFIGYKYEFFIYDTLRTSVLLTGPIPDVIYWRVRIHNTQHLFPGWSEVWHFTVQQP